MDRRRLRRRLRRGGGGEEEKKKGVKRVVWADLAAVLDPAHPDGVGADGGDGGAVAGAVLPLHVDRLPAPEPG